ncbi:hypothetical protein AVEN_218995-1 [Araneus ventricosus]|uniref:Uncharacterized protein n=1 Tax=Araneus ventricosus TaxID=182803 RepID=A0A4Y2CDP6_ARAVE|nr:hypothetical protein AVEN_218995-1 [Araneus ventricosus]
MGRDQLKNDFFSPPLAGSGLDIMNNIEDESPRFTFIHSFCLLSIIIFLKWALMWDQGSLTSGYGEPFSVACLANMSAASLPS